MRRAGRISPSFVVILASWAGGAPRLVGESSFSATPEMIRTVALAWATTGPGRRSGEGPAASAAAAASVNIMRRVTLFVKNGKRRGKDCSDMEHSTAAVDRHCAGQTALLGAAPCQCRRSSPASLMTCGRGGTGRRAALRSLWPKGRGSSSLLDRTSMRARPDPGGLAPSSRISGTTPLPVRLAQRRRDAPAWWAGSFQAGSPICRA